MAQKKFRDFLVLLEQSPDGWVVARVPDIQGCATQGKTVAQALERIKEAIQVCLEAEEFRFTKMKFLGLQQVQVRV